MKINTSENFDPKPRNNEITLNQRKAIFAFDYFINSKLEIVHIGFCLWRAIKKQIFGNLSSCLQPKTKESCSSGDCLNCSIQHTLTLACFIGYAGILCIAFRHLTAAVNLVLASIRAHCLQLSSAMQLQKVLRTCATQVCVCVCTYLYRNGACALPCHFNCVSAYVASLSRRALHGKHASNLSISIINYCAVCCFVFLVNITTMQHLYALYMLLHTGFCSNYLCQQFAAL